VMRVTPIEKFGIESFFGCDGILFVLLCFGSGWLDGFVPLEGGCGGCCWTFGWRRGVIIIIVVVAQTDALVLEFSKAVGLVATSFTNSMSIQHSLICRTNSTNVNHLPINHRRLCFMSVRK